ncbi:nitrite reductase/ring-hydroxylating ferredoxin subunit [Crossiella equi]|uniref:Nitrite reductase/ring-hydroxylating ferredoxin subunit n=1 Tax=Crossiella equi TaxID=130796 RepID=A0ABS5AP04_9PSEU|nr:Rieske (2Fe-2S) protein [Crossiella equi]MBP2478286.1 nitrite reductase/ring-hydroxylating ferredoxin subunit [Crossiella equi]
MPEATRRTVLCGLLALAGTAACGPAAPRRTGGTGTAKPGAQLTTLADLPATGGKLVDVEGGGVLLVVRAGDGTVRAFDPRCPHTGALVNPPAGGQIDCPLHGSTFDGETGALRKGPASSSLRAVPVKVEHDRVLLG